jgi:acyl-CoA thioesterase
MHIDKLFEQVKDQITQNQHSAELSVTENWTQGRTLYGGISASLVYQAALGLVDSDKKLRALNTHFIGPIEADSPFTIKVEKLREGKSTTVVRGDIFQNEKIALSALVTFGIDRESEIQIDNLIEHQMEKPLKASFMPIIPKITPNFIGNFEMAKVLGDWPITGSKQSVLHGWMRFKQPPVLFTDAHLVAIIDMWPPTVIQMLSYPAPASTMSWNLEFIYPHRAFKNDEWFAYQASTRQASSGYAHTEANIWDESGALVAISRQTVAVFA